MTLVPMRFKNYEWRYNPEEISFECEKNIQELNSPKNTAYIQSLGRKNRLIKGKGQLCGEDCHEQFANLWEVFEEGGVGVLALPFIKPVYASGTLTAVSVEENGTSFTSPVVTFSLEMAS